MSRQTSAPVPPAVPPKVPPNPFYCRWSQARSALSAPLPRFPIRRAHIYAQEAFIVRYGALGALQLADLQKDRARGGTARPEAVKPVENPRVLWITP